MHTRWSGFFSEKLSNQIRARVGTSAGIGSNWTKSGIASTKRVSVELNSSYVTALKSPTIIKSKLYIQSSTQVTLGASDLMLSLFSLKWLFITPSSMHQLSCINRRIWTLYPSLSGLVSVS